MIKKTKLLIIVVGVLLTACFEKEVAPVLEFPGEANMTIAEFQQLHELSGTNPATMIDTNIVITGIVTSTDQFGSAYQEIFFQDETGGISIRIASSRAAPYYSRYRIGQRIFVKTEGLLLGNYTSVRADGSISGIGFYQLGAFGNGRLNNLIRTWENRHIFPSGISGSSPAPKIIRSRNDIVEADYHTLVRLENCSFAAANGTTKYFEAPSHTTNTISRIINFNQGIGMVEARISRYNTFADDTLPAGALNITGILTMFGSSPASATAQLIILSINDVEILPPPLPIEILASFDMTTNPLLEGWENKQVTGTDVWTYHSQGVNSRVEISSRNETECWLVSPKFNFSGAKNVALFFTYRFLDGANENMQILYTTNGTDWLPLNFTPQMTITTEGMIKLEESIATHPNLQITFKYKTTTLFPTWIIRGISFKANVM